MITLEDVYKNIERLDTPFVRIYDFAGNLILSFEDSTNPATTVKRMEEVMPNYTGYNKVTIKAANEGIFKKNYTGAFKWEVYLADGKANKTGAVPQQNMNDGIMMMLFKHVLDNKSSSVPTGYVPQSTIDANNALMLAKMDHMAKMFEMKEKHNDPMKFLPLLPVAYDLLGKDSSKAMNMIGKMSGAVQTAAPTNTLVFEDVVKLSPEDKAKKIEELWEKLTTKIAAEEMICLLAALNENRDLVTIGKLAQVVPAATLNKLIEGLCRKPEMAETAVKFL